MEGILTSAQAPKTSGFVSQQRIPGSSPSPPSKETLIVTAYGRLLKWERICCLFLWQTDPLFSPSKHLPNFTGSSVCNRQTDIYLHLPLLNINSYINSPKIGS
ncbi:unnamed protein product [Ixodes pacificus]